MNFDNLPDESSLQKHISMFLNHIGKLQKYVNLRILSEDFGRLLEPNEYYRSLLPLSAAYKAAVTVILHQLNNKRQKPTKVAPVSFTSTYTALTSGKNFFRKMTQYAERGIII